MRDSGYRIQNSGYSNYYFQNQKNTLRTVKILTVASALAEGQKSA